MKSSLRVKYSELKVLMIDEISMAFNDLLFNIHLRLAELFDFQDNKTFYWVNSNNNLRLFPETTNTTTPVYMHYADTWKSFELHSEGN